ncbi:MAG: response regulator [Candidatus Schekmanbacteria bacterium]|nr:response regulator [Candidatus Schekmanbacteria bacterium]
MKEVKSVLVVDDDEVARETICNSLEDTEYEITTACNGTEALEKIATHEFAAVVCDIKMPGIDGFTVLRKARKTRNIPFIFVTGYPGDTDENVIINELRPFGFLSKPFDHKELILLVKNAVDHYNLTKKRESFMKEMEKISDAHIKELTEKLKYII